MTRCDSQPPLSVCCLPFRLSVRCTPLTQSARVSFRIPTTSSGPKPAHNRPKIAIDIMSSQVKNTSPSAESPAQISSDSQCRVCHKHPIQYAAVPCGCPALCKSCAMKQATGGKCKVCGSFFGELRRI
ncbi:uncharacterized protein BJ171DRAFT_17142 [Polychytrium aggregatum]|uniref:uncharacterized protein n=1 Tax=Polychytrium aggregatum TaxID=110093 RepID=UPI0022FF051C|nr:uncharacterized protein BJ171DRAFT_17142 [Polychytrium aggregatum]KAI9206677.1 hypothetical protein BJ171DRAFT_17142 [Polychytrium aggregatum]